MNPSRRNLLALGVAWSLCYCAPVDLQAEDVDFTRDIRPIFSDHCFKCHGPDENQRQADLRLDREESVRSPLREHPLLSGGAPEKSDLYLRITSDDSEHRMPPADQERQLSESQIDLIRRWIDLGAKWKSHWAFETPSRPALPQVSRPDWTHNGVDYFILHQLDRVGFTPSPPADKRTLLRRVSLDLTGLPPTPQEVEEFLSDDSPGAYERVVDRLLASPRYGERMAGDWLDAARYADTSGYQNDGPREMWRWRDWVIDAFNENKPFDEFTIEQLAGDLLPRATLSQKIATGFNRNHRGNAEGGIIPEEFQVEYVVDRVETTSTVWLGLTLGCVRCHDHKYDPFSQAEFYQLFALFNNIPEHGRAVKEGNSPPYIKAPTAFQLKQRAELERRLAELAEQCAESEAELLSSLSSWEQKHKGAELIEWQTSDGLLAEYTFEEPTSPAVEGKPTFAEHRQGRALVLDGRSSLDMGDVANFDYFDKFSISCWINPQTQQLGTILSRMEDVPQGSGYSIVLAEGQVQVNLVKRWLDDSIRVQTSQRVPDNEWSHLMVSYDGSRLASGLQIWVNGQKQRIDVNLDYINQSFANADAPLRVGAGHGPDGRFRGMIDDIRVYERVLRDEEVADLSEAATIREILQLEQDQRTAKQIHKLREWYLATHAPASLRKLFTGYKLLRRQIEQFEESLPTVMVMQELPEQRPTHVLQRGEYDRPGQEVSPGVPTTIDLLNHPVSNRLDFARWLVDPRNPLTARVAANRMWQQFFGTGLVKTAEDFGSQGELPSHPELLDWLATELIRLDWDVKQFLKLIVMSATYQQASEFRPELVERDPHNRWLARSPRRRLSARAIRDQALFVSGLLHEQLKGPSVRPYQPAGLWKEIATTTNYEQSTGTDLYRRSLYTYWKRTVAPPNMALFDAAGREMCVVRSTRTNTPLQALNAMNDVTYLEAARVLAERCFREAGSSRESRISHAFLLALAREPDATERSILTKSYQKYLTEYSGNNAAATQLLSHGTSQPDPKLDPAELAAMTVVTATILNLDEVLTRE